LILRTALKNAKAKARFRSAKEKANRTGKIKVLLRAGEMSLPGKVQEL